MQAVSVYISIFQSLYRDPKSAFEELYRKNSKLGTLLIPVIAGELVILQTGFTTDIYSPSPFTFMLDILVAGPILGILSMSLFALLSAAVGKTQGSDASYSRVLLAWSWGSVLFIILQSLAMIAISLALVLFGTSGNFLLLILGVILVVAIVYGINATLLWLTLVSQALNLSKLRTIVNYVIVVFTYCAAVSLAAIAISLSTGNSLLDAIYENDIDLVRAYLDEGVNLEEQIHSEGLTPLITASMFGRTEIVQMLLNSGANVDSYCMSGFPALSYALREGHEDVAEILLKRGANPNSKSNPSQITPLMMAAYGGHFKSVDLVLKHGASVHAKDVTSKGVKDYALSNLKGSSTYSILNLIDGRSEIPTAYQSLKKRGEQKRSTWLSKEEQSEFIREANRVKDELEKLRARKTRVEKNQTEPKISKEKTSLEDVLASLNN